MKKSDVQSRTGRSEEGIGGGAKSAKCAKAETRGEVDSMTRGVGMGKRVEEIHVALRKKVVTNGSTGHMAQRRVSRKT